MVNKTNIMKLAFNKELEMSRIELQTSTNNNKILKLKKENVLILSVGPQRLRAVTHLDVDSSDIEKAVNIIKKSF